jgi:hypothetical protein
LIWGVFGLVAVFFTIKQQWRCEKVVPAKKQVAD